MKKLKFPQLHFSTAIATMLFASILLPSAIWMFRRSVDNILHAWLWIVNYILLTILFGIIVEFIISNKEEEKRNSD